MDPARARSGFTLLEVLISVVILGITMLGVQAIMADRTIQALGGEERRAVANQLLDDRIDEIQALASENITLVVGSEEVKELGSTTWTRTTEVAPTSSPTLGSYLTVTVTVTTTGLPNGLSRTIMVMQQ
jgi:prepilin-type N-terminal cleavage/methylation domain-containing protein